jgi:hypothetical protein
VTDEARSLLRAAALMTVLTVGSYALLKYLPGWELTANGMRERMRETVRSARAWERAKNEVIFEAYLATREAAQNDRNA